METSSVTKMEQQADPKKLKMDDAIPERKYKRRKIAILFAYCGVGYQGMQKNPGAKTIESDLEDALFLAGAVPEADRGCPKRYDFARSARTDKGVSAVGQVVSGRFYVDPPGLVDRLNSLLPNQIRIFGFKRATPSFNAKKYCDRRRYVYLIPVFALDPSSHPDRESVLASLGSGNELVKCLECSERGRKVEGVMGKHVFRLKDGQIEVNAGSGSLPDRVSTNLETEKEEETVSINSNDANCNHHDDIGDGIDLVVSENPGLGIGTTPTGISSNNETKIAEKTVVVDDNNVNSEADAIDLAISGNVQLALGTQTGISLKSASTVLENEIDNDNASNYHDKVKSDVRDADIPENVRLGMVSEMDILSNNGSLLSCAEKGDINGVVLMKTGNGDLGFDQPNGNEVGNDVGVKEKEGAQKGSKFRYGEEERERFNRILKTYVGTHNFHNFTTRIKAEDPSATRYIISFEANTVVNVDGIDFVKCEVVGQSFMLHQIRKMVGVAVAIMKNCADESLIELAFQKDLNITVPTAPEVGLYLDECFFSSYNQKWKDTHEEVSMEAYADEAEEFKMKHIYSHIASMEHREGSVALWLHSLNYRNYPDLRTGDTRGSFEMKVDEPK